MVPSELPQYYQISNNVRYRNLVSNDQMSQSHQHQWANMHAACLLCQNLIVLLIGCTLVFCRKNTRLHPETGLTTSMSNVIFWWNRLDKSSIEKNHSGIGIEVCVSVLNQYRIFLNHTLPYWGIWRRSQASAEKNVSNIVELFSFKTYLTVNFYNVNMQRQTLNKS